jgi:xanthosine utilization system XapX-like protein
MESRSVNKKTDRQDELLAQVEKSEARLKERSQEQLADRSPPEKVTDLVREHPGLAIAAGVGLGIVAALLIPKSPARKLARRGGLLAAATTEMAVLLARQAMEKAGEARDEGRERVGEFGGQIGETAHRAAAAGRAAGRNVQRIAGETSAAARDAGSDLVSKAGKVLARLRD